VVCTRGKWCARVASGVHTWQVVCTRGKWCAHVASGVHTWHATCLLQCLAHSMLQHWPQGCSSAHALGSLSSRAVVLVVLVVQCQCRVHLLSAWALEVAQAAPALPALPATPQAAACTATVHSEQHSRGAALSHQCWLLHTSSRSHLQAGPSAKELELAQQVAHLQQELALAQADAKKAAAAAKKLATAEEKLAATEAKLTKAGKLPGGRRRKSTTSNAAADEAPAKSYFELRAEAAMLVEAIEDEATAAVAVAEGRAEAAEAAAALEAARAAAAKEQLGALEELFAGQQQQQG
jgi:hypothetical protein